MSEDFSGLPPQDSRGNGARFVWISIVGVFLVGLVLTLIGLVVLFAPAPYLGVNHAALAQSVDGGYSQGCRPAGDTWICAKGDSDPDRYRVRADWAGCWTGELIGRPVTSETQPKISGCIAIIDHLRAD